MADIPRGASTNASMALGDTFKSKINSLGDRDWIRIDPDKGDWIQVDLAGRGSNPLKDSFVRIYDADRKLVTEDDDSGPGVNSRAIFQATGDGPYYIEASGFRGNFKGKYAVTAQKTTAPEAHESLYWGTQVDDTNVTVYFAQDGDDVATGDPEFNTMTAESWSAFEIAQFEAAFDMLSAVSGLTFTVTTNANAADFTLVMDTDEFGDDGTLGFFNPPGEANEGVGVFNGDAWDDASLAEGGIAFVTIVHELLHGLGLAHPHDDGGGSTIMAGVTKDFDDFGDFDLNQGVFTTMSYNSGYFTGTNGSAPSGDNFGYEAGPMALDIAVLQALYGVGGGHKAGDSNYKLAGANKAGTAWQAIWDTGGTDKISYGGDRDTTIDLRAATLTPGVGAGGYVSSAKGIAGGFTIAHGAKIENARSGQGDDTLIGNGLGNVLKSGRGDDTLKGRSGADTLKAGKGWDDLYGGSGRDTLKGGKGNDTLVGDKGQDKLTGGNGHDVFDFNKASDSKAGSGKRDVITDFGKGGDRINLKSIDADTTTGGNQAFEFIGKGGFSDAGQLRIVNKGADRLVQGDRDGDGQADFEILLKDVSGLGSDDFAF